MGYWKVIEWFSQKNLSCRVGAGAGAGAGEVIVTLTPKELGVPVQNAPYGASKTADDGSFGLL